MGEQQLEGALKPEAWQSNNIYKSVSVLVIYWEQSDNEGFKTEGHEIGQFFARELSYNVFYFRIPSDKSNVKLDKRISEFLDDHGNKDQLAIIYYGGHGWYNQSVNTGDIMLTA